MSSRLPEEAKNSDFEKGKQESPIPFVPIMEDTETDPNSHRVSFKLLTGTKTSIRSWTGLGSNESFVIHIKAVSAAVKGTGKWGELSKREAMGSNNDSGVCCCQYPTRGCRGRSRGS